MKPATQLAIDELRSIHPKNPVARVLRQKKSIADWLEDEYLDIEKDNIAIAMKAVYIKSLEDKRFDINQFINDYLENE